MSSLNNSETFLHSSKNLSEYIFIKLLYHSTTAAKLNNSSSPYEKKFYLEIHHE